MDIAYASRVFSGPIIDLPRKISPSVWERSQTEYGASSAERAAQISYDSFSQPLPVSYRIFCLSLETTSPTEAQLCDTPINDKTIETQIKRYWY